VRKLASSYPRPTNAQAVTALDAFDQYVAGDLIAQGVPEDWARAFALPDGIFPRMRLLAWGWVKPGDRFKQPTDKLWWAAPYKYPLWDPIATYLDAVTAHAGASEPGWHWDAAMAAGDSASLSHSFAAVVGNDWGAIRKDASPKWLIPPPGAGLMPLANPAYRPDSTVDKIIKPISELMVRAPITVDPASSNRIPWWFVVGIAYLLARRKR
jgi:hypothetical protein